MRPVILDAVKFYSYPVTAPIADDLKKLVPPARTPLPYTVTKWEDNTATLTFTLTTSLSNEYEVQYDLAKLTHTNGQFFDINNDGVFDEYDTVIVGGTIYGVTDTTGTRVPRVPNASLFQGSFAIEGATISDPPDAGADHPAYFCIEVNPAIAEAHNENFGTALNNFFKMQRFDIAAKTWVDVAGTGTYYATEAAATAAAVIPTAEVGEFRLPITAPPVDTPYKLVVKDYDAIRNFTTANEYCGFKQKAGIPLGMLSNGVLYGPVIPNPSDTDDWLTSNPFTNESVKRDLNNRNVEVILSLDIGSGDGDVVGDKGLPDPAAALANNHILLGYYSGGFSWNDAVFIHGVQIIPYKDDPEDEVNNRWKLILPADYTRNGSRSQYLFISPGYATLGNDTTVPADRNIRKFGNQENYELYYGNNNFYRAYAIGQF